MDMELVSSSSIAAFISPLRAQRDAARALFAPGDFLEVFEVEERERTL